MTICVILAAGEGKRMRPLTGSRPKVMLPIAGRPMLEHLINAVVETGITDFIIVVGYGESAVRNYFGDGGIRGISIRYVTQKHQLGTGDALMTVAPHVNSPFLLLNGDMILHAADIKTMLHTPAPAMGVFTSSHPQDYGVVTMEADVITGLEEKSLHPPSDLINAGMYLFEPGIFDHLRTITSSPRGELELTDALMTYIEHGTLRGVHLEYWADMGSPWDLLGVHEEMMKTIEPEQKGVIEAGVTIHGNVQIGSGTVILAGSYIEGPCIIGSDCRIGPHAYIRPGTAIGNSCHIGHSSEIKNSIIMDRTNVPHFSYVGDSIIGSGCNLGAGTKIANLRHDKGTIIIGGSDTRRRKFGAVIGDDVLFGINCSVNVGSVIGNHCRIGPHALVEGILHDNTVIRR
ncbi:MAG TPA: sugar phosphate nucleotidyltransferase [Methanospirillum sp.]|uniref:bifunctional sugar-1-phosphate nucleotidylyltransferase/acetyltransferase n=2 Tax=Methanospirillum sp. TaxID=45200 RepID=UPI002CF17F88|nr:bifunctional sugar-1-phosphate nucleotidylyltransferase/acetyltransferase [Methanospirillum sp.]HOJ95811.1 sugar phosphate nucleotidyltransferase [Methanospirillum sp.]HOL40612.1 sugar phosphate nucleotidyltransferase [Methanospirillum sp.]